jgi:hypothetical protein
MKLEPEKGCWWRITRDWYTQVVTEFSGHGKLHHHLGLLGYEAEGEELCGVCPFVKRRAPVSHCVRLNEYVVFSSLFFLFNSSQASQHDCHPSV